MILLQAITTTDIITIIGILLGATAGIWKIIEIIITMTINNCINVYPFKFFLFKEYIPFKNNFKY